MKEFEGKVALVTGGGSGIGRATALAFAREGAQVVIGNRNAQRGEETVSMMRDAGGTASFQRTDVLVATEIEGLVDHAVKTYGRLDLAFNHAGVEGEVGPLVEQSEANYDAIMDVNVKGVWLSMKYEIPRMLERGGGAIVNCSSVAGMVGFPNVAIYIASKHAVIGLTKTAALEYSAQGIRINAVNPAVIDTEIVHVLFLDIVGYSKRLTDEQQALIDQLNQVVRSSAVFQKAEGADRLIKIPTGDGMALIFYNSPEQPVECALEISRELKRFPEMLVRMGVHSGPVSAVTDLNDRTNAAGIGINVAQRVMDCGDSGHILLSKRVAEDLQQNGRWRPSLHDLGEVEVKHGERVHVFNFYTDDAGNPEPPKKVPQAKSIHRAATARSPDRIEAKRARFSICVLPFANMSGEGEQEYFSDGITEDIITDLSKVSALDIISRNTAFTFKNKPVDVRQVAAQLGVSHVLEGSVRKAAGRVRITAQLIDGSNDSHVWAERYDRDLNDIFALQDEISRAIVDALKVKLLPEEKKAIEKHGTENVDAYNLYLMARQAYATGFEGDNRRNQVIVRLCRRATEIDPHYADAWALMALVEMLLHSTI